MSLAAANVPVGAVLLLAGAALCVVAACSPADTASSGAGGQTTLPSGGVGGGQTTSTAGTGAAGGTGGTGDPRCAIPSGASDLIHEGLPAAGLSCTRYPFPLASPRDVVIAKDGSIFVSEFGAGRIVRLTNTGFVTVAEKLTAPIGLREDADGSLLVTEEGLFSLSRIDRTTGARTQLAKMPHNVTYLALGPDGAAYVSWFAKLADTHEGGVFRVDLGSLADAPFATGLDVPEGLFLAGDGRLFVAEWLLPSAVYRFESTGGPESSAAKVATGFQNVYGLAGDGKGGFYAGDHAGKIVHVGGDGVTSDVLTGIGKPGGLWLSGSGDLWIAEFVDFGQTGYLIRLSGL